MVSTGRVDTSILGAKAQTEMDTPQSLSSLSIRLSEAGNSKSACRLNPASFSARVWAEVAEVAPLFAVAGLEPESDCPGALSCCSRNVFSPRGSNVDHQDEILVLMSVSPFSCG